MLFPNTQKLNLLNSKSGRALTAFAFYFAEGAPIGFIWWAMPTLLRQTGVGVDVIGTFTAILVLPWVFKFLWAPLIDIFRSTRYGYKSWIAISQIFMCLTLLPLIFIPIENNVMLWAGLLFLHSLCAATQDVSVDALVINTVADDEKGIFNGYMQAGMLLGRGLFGGGTLIFISIIGLQLTIALMVLVILNIMILLLFIKESATLMDEQKLLSSFKTNLKETFLSKQTWYTLAFALTAAAAFEVAGSMAGPFLTDKGIDESSIGYFFGFPVTISTLIGGIAGGFLSDKIKRKKALLYFLCGFVFMIVLISLIGILNKDVPAYTWLSLFTGMYFFVGMFTSSSYALFMSITNPKLGATQFSTFMAATNACESWAVWTAGLIVVRTNYNSAFTIMCFVSLFSLFFLRKIKPNNISLAS
ncbi:MFS transporter [Aurantibacillus circumpalustris]|uniref:MFS transporter n=1 Tax=Aurantibacillus circumpalustris TaxID=3036359 RepID=UPI00295AF7BE|nr:MFS transporter [Aurantibacillus circumpalustris]